MRVSLLINCAVAGLLVMAAAAAALDDSGILKRYQPAGVDWYYIARHNRTHRMSNLWLTMTNWGFLGNSGDLPDPEFPNTWAPAAEFPGGSGIEYLFAGAVWVGALVDTNGFEFPRVSLGYEGWTGPGNNNYELEPGEEGGLPIQDHGILERSCIPGAVNYLGQPIYSPDAIAPQEFVCSYCDTLVDTLWTGTDITDGPHYPLGLKITQKSMAWDAYGFDDFILFEFTVKNIGAHNLKNPYLAFYLDGDVGLNTEADRHVDDVTGFLDSLGLQPCNVPFLADNDGRPHNIGYGSDFTCPGVSGMRLLTNPQQTLYTSYNWWISNGNPALDFGPHWTDDGSPNHWTDTLGTPEGDARKYFVMSNREIDYDQWYVADQTYLQGHPQVFRDPFTGQTTTHNWFWENLSNGPDVANGYDTRFMISYGPLGLNTALPGQPPLTYLNPGDSTTLAFVYLCGDGFHDPNHPQGDLTGLGPIDPTLYNYTDFVYNLQKAQWLYSQGFQILPPYKPHNLQVTSAPDSAVWLAWNSYPGFPGTAVNIYRRTEGGSYPPTPLNPVPLTDTTWADQTAQVGQRYYYKAQAVRYDTLLSYFCPEITYLAGAPLKPTGLRADSSANSVVWLSWNPNTEVDLNHYLVYRRDTTAVYQVVGNVPAGTQFFADQGMANGYEYTYRISAVDNGGLESVLSDSVTDIPMGLTQSLLVLRERISTEIFGWPDSLLAPYYQQLFQDAGENPDFMDVDYTSYSAFSLSLPQLSPYKIVWLIHDAHNFTGSGYALHRDSLLAQYIENGGKVIVSGRRLSRGAFVIFPELTWAPVPQSHVLRQDFKLDSVYSIPFPNASYHPEFTGAVPAMAGFPPITVDSSKVNQISMINQIPPEMYADREALLEVDGMIPQPEGETFYTFQSDHPDSSALQGHAVGVHYLTPNFANVILSFPLFAMKPYESVVALTQQLLNEVRLGVEEPWSNPGQPAAFALKRIYPNPFNNTVAISYELRTAGKVTLAVYEISGRLVATLVDGWRAAGEHQMTFAAQGLASGMYFVRLKAGEQTAVQKMVLLK